MFQMPTIKSLSFVALFGFAVVGVAAMAANTCALTPEEINEVCKPANKNAACVFCATPAPVTVTQTMTVDARVKGAEDKTQLSSEALDDAAIMMACGFARVPSKNGPFRLREKEVVLLSPWEGFDIEKAPAPGPDLFKADYNSPLCELFVLSKINQHATDVQFSKRCSKLPKDISDFGDKLESGKKIEVALDTSSAFFGDRSVGDSSNEAVKASCKNVDVATDANRALACRFFEVKNSLANINQQQVAAQKVLSACNELAMKVEKSSGAKKMDERSPSAARGASH